MQTKDRRTLQACSIIFIALNQLVPISAHPLENWTWRVPEKPDVTFFNSVAYGNGIYVAAGKHGVLAVSKTGSDWTPIEVSESKDLMAVRYLDGKFIAVGVGGTVLTSPDGGHWTSQHSGTTNTLRDVAFGNNTFVAVGANNTLLCSVDGATWTPNAIGHSISRLVFGNGVFVGASDRQTVASLDGITWTNSTFEANPSVTSLAFGNGTFVTTVHSLSYPEHEKIYVSTDGLAWKSSLTNNRVNWFGEVRFGNNLFIAQLSYRTYLSKDGNTWVRAPSSPILTFLDFAGGKFFFRGGAMLWTTADGFSYATQPTTLDFSAVSFCNGRFVALGKRSAVSTNGTTWTLGEGSPLSGRIRRIIHGKGIYVALDDSGTLTSYDGLSWTPQTVKFSDLIYAKDHFVATCFISDYLSPLSGIQASVDGTNWHWVIRDLYPNIFPDALAFGNERFVAISSGGVVLVSTNLTQWVTNFVGGNSSGYVTGLTFVNGFFLARWSGGAFTSADGFTWTTLPDGPNGSLSGSGIITCNGSFLSPGGGGIMISSNGLDWLAIQGKYSGGITAIATDQRTVVAVSAGGLLQSDPWDATAAPSVVINSRDQTANAGESIALSVSTYGSMPLVFAWRKNGFPIPRETNAVLLLSRLGTNDSGLYDVVVSNGHGAVTSASAAVTVLPGGIPSITVQPQDQYRLPGGKANFAVVAEGSPPLSYEWRKDGLSIPGETNSTLLFFGVSLTNAGEYVAVVSNASGCVTSTIATLYISAAAAPTILTQIEPKRPTVLEGGTVSFTVSATGFPPPTYQWRTDGLVLPGATNNVLTLNNVQRSIGAFIINVIVSNEVGSIIASGASVAVVWPPQMFEISDVNAAEGAFIRIGGSVSARPDPVYQWFKDGQPISQAGVLTFSPIQSGDAGVYFLRASNSLGWAESQPVKVRVVPQGPLDKWHFLGQFSPPLQASLFNFVFAGNTFLVLGYGGYAVSTNGSTWVDGTGPNLFLLDTAFGNGVFVSVGSFGPIVSSTDGLAWTSRSVSNRLNGIAFGNGRFVAIGVSGEILSSTNGMDWVPTMSTATGNFEDIAYGNGLFVIVGWNQILSSSDGLLWTSRWHPAERLFSIAAGNGKFVASGTHGEVYISTDAINWQRVDLRVGLYSPKDRVSYGNGLFLAGGPAGINTGVLFSSEDGLNWTQRCIGTNVFRFPVYRNGTFVVVGQDDFVFESDSTVRLSLNAKMPPELQFWGPSGSAYSLEYTDHLGVVDSWQVLTNFVGPASPFIWTDPNVSPNSRRFYRAVVTE